VHNFRETLTCFTKPTDPRAWGAYFRGSPAKWSTPDGELLVKAHLDVKENPTIRPVDKKKLAKRPPVFVSRDDTLVTVPETAEPELSESKDVSLEVTDRWSRPEARDSVAWPLRRDRRSRAFPILPSALSVPEFDPQIERQFA